MVGINPIQVMVNELSFHANETQTFAMYYIYIKNRLYCLITKHLTIQRNSYYEYTISNKLRRYQFIFYNNV